MKKENKLTVPEQTTGDVAAAAGRSILGAIPFAGPLAVEAFSGLVTPPLQRRQEKWVRAVTDRLNQLAANGLLNFDELGNNDNFLSVVYQSTLISLKTIDKTKRQGLLGAIESSVTDKTLHESLITIYMDLIGELSPIAIKYLIAVQENHQQLYEHRIEDKELREKLKDELLDGRHDLDVMFQDNLRVSKRLMDYDQTTGKTLIVLSRLGADFLAFLQLKPNAK